jgi:hypothetical protein
MVFPFPFGAKEARQPSGTKCLCRPPAGLPCGTKDFSQRCLQGRFIASDYQFAPRQSFHGVGAIGIFLHPRSMNLGAPWIAPRH